MEEPGLVSTILNALNIGALGVIVYFFIKGQIISKPTLDKIIEAMENITLKQVNEIGDKVESAVENGVTKAYQKMADKNIISGD